LRTTYLYQQLIDDIFIRSLAKSNSRFSLLQVAWWVSIICSKYFLFALAGVSGMIGFGLLMTLLFLWCLLALLFLAVRGYLCLFRQLWFGCFACGIGI